MPNLATVGQKIAREKAAVKRGFQAQNSKRAEGIRKILEASPYDAKTEGCETALADLLANIRHFCDSKGLAFSEVDMRAQRHYSAEVVQARSEKT